MNTDRLIRQTLRQTVSIAFDGCHKIYLNLDEEQDARMREWGYGDDGSFLVKVKQTEKGREKAFDTLREWYDSATDCGLQFINSVRTTPNPNDGYISLVEQGDYWR